MLHCRSLPNPDGVPVAAIAIGNERPAGVDGFRAPVATRNAVTAPLMRFAVTNEVNAALNSLLTLSIWVRVSCRVVMSARCVTR
jgi:phosphoribosylcarboxyaminoimidazole (NCAIR) mutase